MLDDAALWGEVLKFVPVLGALRAQRVAKLFRQAARLEPRRDVVVGIDANTIRGALRLVRRSRSPGSGERLARNGPSASGRSQNLRHQHLYIPMFASSAQAGR